MARYIIIVCLIIFPCSGFDVKEYLKEEHDKMYFGVGGGLFSGINAEYRERFPEHDYPAVILQAGIGDYPFVFNVQYTVLWAEGFSRDLVSGQGSRSTEYQVVTSARTYLFWKNRYIKNYILSGIVAAQEKLISTDDYQFTEGIRFGLCLGICFDFSPSEYAFVDLGFVYKFLNSDFFDRKELFSIELVLNIGK